MRVHLTGNGESIQIKDYNKYVQPHFLGLSNLFDIVLKLAILLFGEFVESFNTVGTFLQKQLQSLSIKPSIMIFNHLNSELKQKEEAEKKVTKTKIV